MVPGTSSPSASFARVTAMPPTAAPTTGTKARAKPGTEPRAPVEPSVSVEPSAVSVTLVGPTTYEVRRGDVTAGYIDIVGGVYVALAGERYDHAVEVHQSTVLGLAVAALS